MRSAPRVLACHVRVFHFRAPALPAQRCLGGGFGRGAKPPAEWNVQGVRLACGCRAPPCSWTLLIALARAFLRQAPRPASTVRIGVVKHDAPLPPRSVVSGDSSLRPTVTSPAASEMAPPAPPAEPPQSPSSPAPVEFPETLLSLAASPP